MTREALIKNWDVIQAFKEGKTIQYRRIGDKLWETCDDELSIGFYSHYEYRVKPESTKRLPTIEEVEDWFLENKVFKLKSQIHGLYRMETISIEQKSLRIGGRNVFIEELCEDFTNYDGSELYITEN